MCLGRHQPAAITPDDEPVLRRILEQVAASTPRDEWFDDPPAPPRRIDELVEWLVEEDYLAVEDPLDGSVRLTERAENWL